MHKRANTINIRKEKEGDENGNQNEDKRDYGQMVDEVNEERNPNVSRHVKNFQSRIDEKNERDKNRDTQNIDSTKNIEDKDKKKRLEDKDKRKNDETIKVVSLQFEEVDPGIFTQN
eukprot:11574285-Heterocapsa_arctica.AAC.1